MSPNPKQALPLLRKAEEALKILIHRTLEEDQYDIVARVAQVAGSISESIAILEASSLTPTERDTKEYVGPQRTQPRGRKDRPSMSHTGVGGKNYPRFERDEREILKIGWSKKKRKEYVHRAPSGVVWAVARILRGRSVPDSRFAATEVLPLVDDGGEGIPSYQVYLALAWLRNEGVISGNGREGYLVDLVGISDASLEALWQALPKQACRTDE